MALLHLVYRDQLFPREAYRRTFEALLEQLGERLACRRMVALLALAHERSCEAELAQYLAEDLEAGRLPDLNRLGLLFAPDPESLPQVHVQLGTLRDYDVLLAASGLEVCA